MGGFDVVGYTPSYAASVWADGEDVDGGMGLDDAEADGAGCNLARYGLARDRLGNGDGQWLFAQTMALVGLSFVDR